MEIKKFQINKYLTLRLENQHTNIYVCGRLFTQCKFLLLNIPINTIRELDSIDSIDEAEEILDTSLEGNFSKTRKLIPSEVEFWGHCSNLQAWVENDYDTRLLHRNLAFPLLKRLTEAGDRRARQVFREEIAQRLASNYPTVIKYLINQNYLKYLKPEDWNSLIYLMDFDVIRDLVRENTFIDSTISYAIYENSNFIIDRFFSYNLLEEHSDNFLHINQNYDIINALELLKQKQIHKCQQKYGKLFIQKIEKELSDSIEEYIINTVFRNVIDRSNKYPSKTYKTFLKLFDQYLKKNNIQYTFYKGEIFEVRSGGRYMNIGLQEHYIENKLVIYNRDIQDISEIEGLENMQNLEGLDLYNNDIKNMEYIENLPCLKILNLNHNNIQKINGLSNATELLELHLDYNYINSIEGLDNLKNLELLNLSNNSISIIEGIESLKNLNKLDLKNNKIKDLKGIQHLRALEELYLDNNFISNLDYLSRLENLKVLNLSYNHVTSLEPLSDLKDLRYLNLDGTRITDISPLAELPNLKKLKISNTSIVKIPDSFVTLGELDEIELLNCELKEFPNDLVKKLLCYSQKDIAAFEQKYPTKNAIWSNKPTLAFKKWLWKKLLMNNYEDFDKDDIERFEKETGKNAIWGFKPTKNFLEWLK